MQTADFAKSLPSPLVKPLISNITTDSHIWFPTESQNKTCFVKPFPTFSPHHKSYTI